MRRILLEIIHRLAAVICLAGTYQFAVTQFDIKWLIVTLVSALVVATGPAYWTQTAPAPQPLSWPQRAEWRRLIPGWGLMALSAVGTLAHLPAVIGLWVWLIGLAWLLWAARQLSLQGGVAPPHPPRAVWAWGLVVLAVAAVPRAWEIDSVPRYVHCDEGATPMTGLRFFNEPDHDYFGALNAGDGTTLNLCYALGGIGARLWGLNLPASRAPDVVLGSLSVAFLFDGLWRVSNLPVAVASALLLAANHSHLAFSRIASGYIQTAFVVSLMFALFARFWTAPSYLNAALMGVAAAVGAQTYRASMALPPLLVGVMLLLALFHSERRRTWLAGLCIFALSAVAAGAPATVTLWQQRGPLFSRSSALNIFTDYKMKQLKEDVYHTDSAAVVAAHQAWNSLRGFHVGHDTQPQYGSVHPMADPYTAALMVPGVLLAVLRPGQFATLNALIITAGYLLLGLGLQWAPGFNRTTGALPLAMVFPAIALVQCCGTLWAGRGWLMRSARNLCVAAGVLFCVYTNLYLYFVDYKWSVLKGDAGSEAAWVARDNYRRYTVHLVNWPLPGPEGQTLIIGDLPIPRHKVYDSIEYVTKAPVTGADLFVIEGQDPKARDALLARFPEGRLEVWSRDPYGPNLFLIFVGQPRDETRQAASHG